MSHLRNPHLNQPHQQDEQDEQVHPPHDHGHDGHGHDHAGHGHQHGHGHDRGGWGRVGHAVSGLFGGHSHDAADQIDDALEADQAGRRALLISLAGLGVTALVQGVVVVLSGSVALLGDTFHNVADALTAVPLLIAFALGRRPVSKRYTYGSGGPRTSPACSWSR